MQASPNHMTAPETAWSDESPQGLCPLVDHPLPDCYCLELTSRSIVKAIEFCLGDYRLCAIFQARPVNH